MLAFHGYPINDLQYVSSDVFYFFVDVTDQIRGKFCPRLFEDPQFKYTDTTVELLDEKTADAYDRDKISMSPYHFPIGRLWVHPNYQMLDVILGIIIGSDRIVWDCHRDLGKGNWKLVAVKIGYFQLPLSGSQGQAEAARQRAAEIPFNSLSRDHTA